MLLPQSSAFAALKNRLNSVSAIGYLHIAPRTYVNPPSFQIWWKSTDANFGNSPQTPTVPFDRSNRLKSRDEGGIKWVELLEKFKSVQEKARRARRLQNPDEDRPASALDATIENPKDKALSDTPKQGLRPSSAAGGVGQRMPSPGGPLHKPKSSLGNLGRFAGGVAGRKGKK